MLHDVLMKEDVQVQWIPGKKLYKYNGGYVEVTMLPLSQKHEMSFRDENKVRAV